MKFTVQSDSFRDGDFLPLAHILSADYGFGCGGGNKSPQLFWSGAPAGTKSFAVTLYDPDAPTSGGFWHWGVVNIPGKVTSIALDAGSPTSGALPKGAVLTRTDFGKPGYAGPCVPEGEHPHRFLFTVSALDVERLDVNGEMSAAMVGYFIHVHTLVHAGIMGLSSHRSQTGK